MSIDRPRMIPADSCSDDESASPDDDSTSSEVLYNRTFAIAFFSQLGFVISNTLTTHYARWIGFLGGDVLAVGEIMGAGSVAGLVVRPWIGQWIDRVGARTTWLLGYALFAVGNLSNLLLTELGPWIYLCRSILVVGASLVFSSSLAYITHHAPASRRTEAIGILGVAGFTGIVIGPFLGDLILSGERTRDDFTLLFCLGAGVLLIPSFLLTLLPRPESETRSKSRRLVDFIRITRKHWPGSIAIVQAVFGLCMAVPFVFMTKYIDDTGLQDAGFSKVSLFFMCYAGWGLVLRILSRRIPELYGRRKMLLCGASIMGFGMLSFLLVNPQQPTMIVVPALLCGSGHALMFHTGTSLFLHTFPPEVRGVGSALSLMTMDIGMIGGAPILGWLADSFGYGELFIAVGVCSFVSAIIYAITSIPVWRSRAGNATVESA